MIGQVDRTQPGVGRDVLRDLHKLDVDAAALAQRIQPREDGTLVPGPQKIMVDDELHRTTLPRTTNQRGARSALFTASG